MIRIDGHYLYQLGYRLHRVHDIEIFSLHDEPVTSAAEAARLCLDAQHALNELVAGSVFRPKSGLRAASELNEVLGHAHADCRRRAEQREEVDGNIVWGVQSKLREFEAILRAELGTADLYLVGPKGAFDTQALVEMGEIAFPSDLGLKVPEAIQDARQAMRCIAFELATAAAFHLHRANEIVLGRYWDTVTNQDRPPSHTIGAYIGELTKRKFGDEKIITALRDIKDMHRNPTIHADQTLETVEEAVCLYGAVRAVIGFMLAAVPAPKAAPPTDSGFSSSLVEALAEVSMKNKE